jgi:hypothetical protein
MTAGHFDNGDDLVAIRPEDFPVFCRRCKREVPNVKIPYGTGIVCGPCVAALKKEQGVSSWLELKLTF